MYKPQWKGPIEGYVANFLARHFWRVERIMDRDDAMQEAYLVFMDCEQRYAANVSEAKHFMALFKQAWFTTFTDLANKATRRRAEVSSTADTEDGASVVVESVGDLQNEGEVRTLVRQAPSEVRTVLALFLNAPAELLELAAQAWKAGGRKEVEGERAISTLLGLPAGSTPIKSVYAYFVGK